MNQTDDEQKYLNVMKTLYNQEILDINRFCEFAKKEYLSTQNKKLLDEEKKLEDAEKLKNLTDSNCLTNIVLTEWEESERDWGERPNGYSLHLTKEDSVQYIKDYWDSMPNKVPDEYSRPLGSHTVQVSNNLYNTISATKNGIRVFEINDYILSADLKWTTKLSKELEWKKH